MRLYFDIEGNGFLDSVTHIWCICAIDLDSDREWSWGPDQIDEGLEFLGNADLLVAHYGHGYDFPALKKVKGWNPLKPERQDSVILAKLANSDLKRDDAELVKKGKLDKNLQGSDKLKAWGQRIGEHKAEYEGGFDAWNQEMQDYCAQDVRTGKALWWHLDVDNMDPRSIWVEHRAYEVTSLMTEAGWPFKEEVAGFLYSELVGQKAEIEQELVDKFGSWQEVDKVLIPKRDNKKLGYVTGVPVTKYKTITFNPGSRRHIEKKLREAGWEPTEFTPSGQAKLDEPILLEVAEDYPEAKLIVEYLLLQKRLGQIGDGDNGWLKLVKNGRIHATYHCMGTVTGRASHAKPNIAQVPKVKTGKDADGNKIILYGRAGVWGADCRDLFTVPEGWSLVGADFEGLELRCLASYMAAFDKGEYGKVVCDGDIHTVNQKAAGLPSRDNAKTFIYGWLYGAGDLKIGKIVGKGAAVGKRLKAKFLSGLPALAKLRKVVSTAAEKGWLKGLDGRRIPIRAKHAALNSLLQSCGAILCKTWLIDSYDALLAAGYRWGWDGDFVILGWIHDELQIAVREGLEDAIGDIVVKCAQEAGARYTFRCRLDSKAVPGKTWKDTH